MTVCSSNSLKRKFFHGEGRVFPERGRGKVCQNRGGITGSREKRTRRLRDIDFIAHATNFARIGFSPQKKPRFHAVLSPKDDPRRFSIGGWKSERGFFNKSRSIFSPVRAKFCGEDHRSDYFHDHVSTERSRRLGLTFG